MNYRFHENVITNLIARAIDGQKVVVVGSGLEFGVLHRFTYSLAKKYYESEITSCSKKPTLYIDFVGNGSINYIYAAKNTEVGWRSRKLQEIDYILIVEDFPGQSTALIDVTFLGSLRDDAVVKNIGDLL